MFAGFTKIVRAKLEECPPCYPKVALHDKSSNRKQARDDGIGIQADRSNQHTGQHEIGYGVRAELNPFNVKRTSELWEDRLNRVPIALLNRVCDPSWASSTRTETWLITFAQFERSASTCDVCSLVDHLVPGTGISE